jgi:hypothetical protein
MYVRYIFFLKSVLVGSRAGSCGRMLGMKIKLKQIALDTEHGPGESQEINTNSIKLIKCTNQFNLI